MGLFDGWRRKKRRSETAVKLQKPERVMVPDSEVAEEVTSDDLSALLKEYEELGKRKEALQIERDELTARLDRDEIDAIAFRKELMNKIQEAATVSEKIQVTGAKLVSLGYRGIL
jgi:LPS O-antigen subunit length determinant protein (WzzB/FepE family)